MSSSLVHHPAVHPPSAVPHLERAASGCSRTISMPGPAIQSLSMNGRERYHWVAVVDQHHQLEVRRQPADPAQGHPGERHHPRRRVLAGPAELVEELHQAPLDQPGVAGRVLGLDGQLHPTRVVRHGLQQPAQGQHLAELGVGVGRLVVEVGPGVLPRREVEVLEVGELHRGDHGVAVRRTPEVAVVDADQVPVGREPYVALEGLGPLVQRRDVGTERVLGAWRSNPGVPPPEAAPRPCRHCARPGRHSRGSGVPSFASGFDGGDRHEGSVESMADPRGGPGWRSL